MVVFTCGHCGESVQKPKVEKHYLTKCRNRNPNLSCMDCFKDFLGHDYESHTKCVTEEERYSGKGFMAKEKKGEKKQTAWVEMVQSVLDEQKGAPKNVIRIIETISKHNNTPRKKPKFYNFVKNVCGQKTGAKDIEQAWDFLSVKLAALSTSYQQNQLNGNKNGSVNGKSEPNSEDEQNGDEKQQDVQNNMPNKIVTDAIITENNTENGEVHDEENHEESNKKLSKKERKEEKKRRKYEAELQSAAAEAPPADDEEEEEITKKDKKKKNKSESHDDTEEQEAEAKNNKNKKRKRQDTTNSITEIIANGLGTEDCENVPIVSKEKTVKKKLKVKEEDVDESICLHDQNVAKIEGLSMKPDKFNWHATIMSVLQKKGNEVQFKRLQKKVLMEYSEATGQEVDDRIADKFIKKLKSAPNVRVDKNRVVLLD